MSWVQIRSAINSNLTRTLDALINDRFNQQETQINTVNTRIGTIDTNLTTTANSIATITTQNTQILNITTRSHTIASNTVQERLFFSPPVQTISNDTWTRAARIIAYVPGEYRLNVFGNFTTINQTINLRIVNIEGSVIASTASAFTNSRFLTFHMNSDGVFFIELAHPTGHPPISLTECTLCYDLANVPRTAVMARS